MDQHKKKRTVIRRAFSRALISLQEELSQRNPDLKEVQADFALLRDRFSELERLDNLILDLMVDDVALIEVHLDTETELVDEYCRKYEAMKREVAALEHELEKLEHDRFSVDSIDVPLEAPPTRNIRDTAQPPAPPAEHIRGGAQPENRRSFKLPKITLKKFNGDLKEWLPFWSQFQYIHEDVNIIKEEKFQYLLQAMEPNTRASDLAYSYPPTADNYDKVITSLKSRFGRNELLVEVYIRELLKLVLNNALKSKGKVQLSGLYDKLETQMRSLESLGVNTETCAAMLYPLVESSLPEEILRAWQRQSGIAMPGAGDTPRDRLANLMLFLQREVDSEERIAMAIKGFSLDKEQTKDTVRGKQRSDQKGISTAAALLTTKENKSSDCVFCGEKHISAQCEKAREMSLEQRQDIVRQKSACFNCAKVGHSSRFCKLNSKCAWCSRRHILLMCRLMNTEKQEKKSLIEETPKKKPEESSLANLSLEAQVLLPTLKVKVYNGNKEFTVRAIFDTASHRSYILAELASQLDYEEKSQHDVVHLLFGGKKSESVLHRAYRIRLANLDSSYACNFIALDQKTICHSIPGIRGGSWMCELTEEKIRFTDVGLSNEPISILIGADVAAKLMTGRMRELNNGATAVETRLGWTLMGKLAERGTSHHDATMMAVSMMATDFKISDLWNLDTLGISDAIQVKKKEFLLEQVKEQFRETVTINKDKRYKVLLPWKENHPSLIDNRDAATKRLATTTKKLISENLYSEYNQVLKEWEQEGIIEEVPSNEENNYGYYLPHRHVLKENSTTRLRPVFDASAQGKGSPSLNQCLEIGPNFIEMIPKLLIRFRQRNIGVISDIKKAFLQISVAAHKRDALRFLWWCEDNPTKVKTYRHCRVVFGVNSGPFLLGATIELHLERELQLATSEEQAAVIRQLLKSFYVDNCITSVNSVEESLYFEKVATETMLKGRFLLRGWERSDTESIEENVSVLGLSWNKGRDTLSLSTSALETTLPNKITKRVILSASHKIFDPIGFACPVLLRPKLLLQKLWSADVNWDAEVCEKIRDMFVGWHEELQYLRHLQIPRQIFDSEREQSISFHVFVDASRDAYAAVLFARTESARGVKVMLIEAKSRVAPYNEPTIPRLELLAATIGARLMNSVLETLDMAQMEKHYWSDSTTVLSWIKQDNQWAVFVYNRVKEIRLLSNSEDWHHVPGIQNPADLPSRGCSAEQLVNSRWWEGPQWLQESREKWPSAEYEVNEDEVNKELRKSKIKKADLTLQMGALLTVIPDKDKPDEPWYLRGLSEYLLILRRMAWILRFITVCREKSRTKRRKQFPISEELSAVEIISAELKLWSLAQSESFSGVEDERIRSLNAYKDQSGIIRLKTPISSRSDVLEFRYPVILPSRHPLVTKLIRHTHEELQHAGIHFVMSRLRERVWILSSRRTIRSVIAKCVVCKRFSAKSMKAPPSVLPEQRVRDAVVFEVTGVDMAGPLFLRQGQKAWICLFTCAVYRAIHMELVTSLSTEGFLEAFRRFVARRGRPSIVFSDNGIKFYGGQ